MIKLITSLNINVPIDLRSLDSQLIDQIDILLDLSFKAQAKEDGFNIDYEGRLHSLEKHKP